MRKINILKTSELSFYNDYGILTLNAKQFDTGRVFVFNIMDNDEPFDLTGCDVYLRIAKADRTQFQGHECCIVNGSSITVDTSVGNGNQILTAAGINKCELHLKNSDGVTLTTWTFNIYVEKRVHDGNNIISINSYDVLDNMINMEKERIENEQKRISNEKERVQNEDQRILKETQRTLDETERQKNESERQKTFLSVLGEAKSYADAASTSADNAKISENNSAKSEENASNSAKESESYAHGETGIRENEDIDNSKYWCKKSEEIKESAKLILNEVTELLEKTNQNVANVNFEITDDGELLFDIEVYDFEINDNGELEWSVI